MAAGQDARHVGGVRHRRGARRPAADLPVPGQRSGGGHAGQAPRTRHAGRPPHPADGPGRNLRRHRASGAAARRARQHRRARPRQAARDPPADLDAHAGREDGPRSRARGPARRGLVRRHAAARRRLAVRDQGRPDPRRAAHPRRKRPRAKPNSIWCWRSCARASCSAATRRVPGLRQALGLAEDGTRRPRRRRRRRGARPRTGCRAAGLGMGRRASSTRSPTTPTSRAILRFAATEVVPRLAGTAGEIHQILRALDGRFIPAGPSGSPLRGSGQRAANRPQLLLRRPEGGAVAAGVGNRCGDGGFAAGPATATTTATGRGRSGCRCGARRPCAPQATTSPKCSRCSGSGRSGTTRRDGW